MFQTIEEIMEYLHKCESAVGLEHIKRILDAVGNPEREFRSIHIAGSNGKGSTLKVIKEILNDSGFKVGTFISPHLEVVNERIMINDKMISDAELLELMNKVAPILKDTSCSYFEILTILAFMYFEKMNVDIAIIETGLGGRLDSTNVITPLLSIITSISLEHTNILGNTLGEIAGEKAGIIKYGVPVLSGVRDSESYEVIKAKAESEHAALYSLDREIIINEYKQHENTQSFSLAFSENKMDNLIQPMFGWHQADNAALGVSAILLLNELYGWDISDQFIYSGLAASKWPGRFEKVAQEIIVDGAHNLAGINVLLRTLKERYPDKKYSFVFTVLKDKQFKEMLELLDANAYRLFLTHIENDRSTSLDDLLSVSGIEEKQAYESWEAAVKAALQTKREDEILIFTGSLYFISLVRPYLRDLL